jgi:hypothetical protein
MFRSGFKTISIPFCAAQMNSVAIETDLIDRQQPCQQTPQLSYRLY